MKLHVIESFLSTEGKKLSPLRPDPITHVCQKRACRAQRKFKKMLVLAFEEVKILKIGSTLFVNDTYFLISNFFLYYLDQESSSKLWMKLALESKLLVRPRSKQIVIPARVCREMGEGSKNSSFHTQTFRKPHKCYIRW